MSLHDKMIKDGRTMFRWRSYLPLLMIGPLFMAFHDAAIREELMGDFLEDLWVLFCFIISLFGLAVRCITVGFVPSGTSGRNAKAQKADTLNTTGMYSIVRNPLYLGNFITLLGVMMCLNVWWLPIIGSLGFFIYMERIILAEEAYLHEKFGAVYDEWRAKTPAIIPNFRLWSAPSMGFSWKTVFKREYPGLLAMATAFLVIEMISDLVFENEPFALWIREDMAWPIIYGVILVFYLTLRTLKKHTKLLKVEGR